MVRQWQEFFYEGRYAMSYMDAIPNFAQLAESFGHIGMVIDKPKNFNRKKMRSEGDNWSKAILSGENIWDCLDSNKIDRIHLVQWKLVGDELHRVSLPAPLR